MEFSTFAQLPKSLLDQVIARYGRPAFQPGFMGKLHDGSAIPAFYTDVNEDRALQGALADGWQREQLHKAFLMTWELEDTTQVESDVHVLDGVTHMSDCPMRDGLVRKAQERGYIL